MGKVTGDVQVSGEVGGAEVFQGLVGKDHTPSESVLRLIAFQNGDLMRRVLLLQQKSEVESRRPAADDGNFQPSLPI